MFLTSAKISTMYFLIYKLSLHCNKIPIMLNMSNPHDKWPDEINMIRELNLTFHEWFFCRISWLEGACGIFFFNLKLIQKVKFMSLKNMLGLLLLDNCWTICWTIWNIRFPRLDDLLRLTGSASMIYRFFANSHDDVTPTKANPEITRIVVFSGRSRELVRKCINYCFQQGQEGGGRLPLRVLDLPLFGGS